MRGLGRRRREVSEIGVLNRIIRRTDLGLLIEADPRPAEMVIEDLDLVGGRAGRLPGSKVEMKRARKAMEARNDVKDIENSGTDATDQCEGLSSPSTANAPCATSTLGSKPVKSRSETFKTDETTSYSKPVDPVISNPSLSQGTV